MLIENYWNDIVRKNYYSNVAMKTDLATRILNMQRNDQCEHKSYRKTKWQHWVGTLKEGVICMLPQLLLLDPFDMTQ